MEYLVQVQYINDFLRDDENQGYILKKCFGFSQGQLPRTFGASSAQMVRSLTKTPARTPVGLIKGDRRTDVPV